MLISESREIEMGRQGAQQVEGSIGLYPDSTLQAYVDEIGRKLAARSERPDLPWRFGVVDDPVVNAFALPGGFIYFTRGILTYFNSEAELAAVMGHEIGHVTARHSAAQISRAQLAQVGLGLGSVFVPEVAEAGDILGAGLGLLFLKFGRDDERQADDLGLRYMRRANYDPNEMVDVFTMLGRVSEAAGGGRIPGWLSTHPAPEDRRERILAQIQEAPGPATGEVGRDRYLQRIDGVVFGENPRNGFFRGSLFLHPDLEFRFEFPADWQTQNMAQAVAGISPEKDAVIQLTLSDAATPEEAARQFLGQTGIRTEGTSRTAVNGMTAFRAGFAAETQQGILRGLAMFIAYEGRVYQILGYTSSQRLPTYESALRRSLESFDRLTDPEALAVQPRRLEIVTLDRAMSFDEFTERYPSTIDRPTLAIINGVGEDERLPAGRKMKRVVGGNLPD
jgi:predicted Zn-dependent protease